MQCLECDAALSADARFCSSCGARVQTLQEVSDPLRDGLDKAIGFQYRIERLLGRGGMGAVYLAHELALDREVAIKVLPPEQAGAPQLRDRFRREARTAARLNHPNIVPLLTFGEVNGLVYFVMGYVAGESLASRLQRAGPLPSDEARTLIGEIADALDYAHRHGVVHRDIKPDNILIDAESGSPRLTDFGIAKASFADAQLTSTGQLMGTPAYMSPEQVLGRMDIDARSDLYSLGVTAYEMLSGQLPFDAENPMEALTQRLSQKPRPLRTVAPNTPGDLALAIDRCLERDPANRWPDAKSLRLELIPTEDDTDDTLSVRNLRVGTFALLLITPTFISTRIFRLFDPGSVRTVPLILGAFGICFLLMSCISAVALLRQGFSVHAIIQAAFRQPRGWRFWYPRRFRRRGDVWDRLPMPLRRVRSHFALFFGFLFGVYFPIMIGIFASWGPRVMPGGVQFIPLLLVALLFYERQRVAKQIAASLGTSAVEASKILNMPSWRTASWQRGAAATLIQRNTPAAIAPRTPTPATPAATIGSDNRPTIT